jgi:hypothetical protein
MATYWITFRIADATVAGRSYEDRYNSLVKIITDNSATWWGKTTSYLAFTWDESIDSIAAKCKAAIAPSQDLFLIREMDKQSARICGKNDDDDIYKLMPYLKSI